MLTQDRRNFTGLSLHGLTSLLGQAASRLLSDARHLSRLNEQLLCSSVMPVTSML